MSTNLHPTTRYRPEIDGLRALAVLPVVLFHAGLGCAGGYIGVDIFFVISGFLITSIIQKQLHTGSFVMSHFWEKRIRRILPALIVVILFTIAGAAFSFYPSAFEDFGKELIAQSTLVSNFYFWQQDGYFAAHSESQALLHTWSLSVEEQFYFLFPFLLTWLYKRKNNTSSKTLTSVVLILLTSFAWSCYGVYKFPTASFFLLPARAWEMLIGAALALYTPKKPLNSTLCECISWLAITTIGYCIYQYDATLAFPGLAALPPCLAAGALIYCNKNSLTTPGKLLSLSPMVFTGKISYSFYLWHWPIIVFANYTAVEPLSSSTRWGLVVASFIMAYLSWRFIETPFRTNTIYSRKQFFKAFYISTAIFILSGTIIYKGEGWQQRFSNDVIKLAVIGDERIKLKNNNQPDEFPTIPATAENNTLRPILIWGDSHAKCSIPAFEQLCDQHNASVYVATNAGVPPILNTNRKARPEMVPYNNSVFEFIKKKKIQDVVLVSRWSIYPLGDVRQQKAPSLLDASNSLSPKETFVTRLQETVSRLNQLGVHVWILKQVPLQEFEPPRLIANAARFGHDASQFGVSVEEHINRQKFVNSVFDQLPKENVTVIDPTPIFLSPEGICKITINGKPVYRDRNHLSRYGALQIAPIFEDLFK